MTEGVLPAETLALLRPEAVTPALLYLASEDAPTRAILCAGAGNFARAHVTLTPGLFLGSGPETPERVAAEFAAISDRSGEIVPLDGSEQGRNEITKAMAAAVGKRPDA
jgi:hypothetical protein